jgi:hypothetical protein
MIPDIGLMIGAYVFTRMLQLQFDPEEGTFVKMLGVVTMIVVAICVIDLMSHGSRGLPTP